ncbi:hypothetical protein C5167_031474 [Papaver somniferum]|uniref:Plant thionin family protein n=1 Tax=Papaver somniferum TaxID=3469 RepID=A0A4Y7K5N0_PAPSO|nr:hypothetical protein C5167_031473 [Papaver somniferum]RZC68220.1 hypothetical protein C5167_031474 [Papaver somniferum]
MMEGNCKSHLRMIVVVFSILGMVLGQVAASRETDFQACFEPCFLPCVKPNPGDIYLSKKCMDKCTKLCNKKSLPDNHRKILAKKN